MWGRTVRFGCAALVAALAFIAPATLGARAADGRYGLGRAPTAAEIAAWEIDVRPDFAGLPKGSGSVERGQEIWEAKCASCHGVFGESNEVFNPIIGGTTADDAKTGHVKSLTTSELQRTTMMKLSSLATLWDYIRRAMPWNAPKSLSIDDVYAVTAYILNLADLVPSSFVLSDVNIRDAERLLPNRNGMTRAHGMWDIHGKPDVRNTACMRDCGDPRITSSLPAYAKNAHGNLALQNRVIGGVRGIDTTGPQPSLAAASASTAAPPEEGPTFALVMRHGCLVCHAVDRKVIGPSFREIAARHGASASRSAIASKIRSGGSGTWGSIPMPAQPQVSDDDAQALAAWIGGLGARR